jgi:hypothetical protein
MIDATAFVGKGPGPDRVGSERKREELGDRIRLVIACPPRAHLHGVG